MNTNRKWGTEAQGTHPREGEAGRDVLDQSSTTDSQKSYIVSLRLIKIAQEARKHPNRSFNNIMHHLDKDLLYCAYKRVNKKAMPGIDQVTAKQYKENLEENLSNLYKCLRTGKYKAPPVKRVYIEKEDGKKRPLGLPTFEDKIVQMAVVMLLEPIWETVFYEFSHGFRRNHSAHQALGELRESCIRIQVSSIVDADVTGFFDNIDHKMMLGFIKKRVSDRNLLRYISKWLHAGVMEGEIISYSEKGTPQGGVISPMLANIFLHYVLDEWFVNQVCPVLNGESALVRYADDFVVAFAKNNDAERFMNALPMRFSKFGLSIHPEKTKMIRFQDPGRMKDEDRKNGTFVFLGFTHYWGRSFYGNWVIKRKTAAKKLRRSCKAIWLWCKKNRHMKIEEQYKILCSKLRGHYQYYGVRCNFDSMRRYFRKLVHSWKYWLERRHRKGKILWKKFNRLLREMFVLPLPKVVHSI